MIPFGLASLLAVATVVAVAARLRGRFFAIFAGVILTIHSLLATAMARHFEAVLPAYVALHALVYLQFGLLARPRLRPRWYRALVSIPGSWFAAGTFLAMPWAVVAGAGWGATTFAIPYVVALLGLASTLRRRREEVLVALDAERVPRLARRRLDVGSAPLGRPLRIVQITDPHLGPFMPEAELRRIAEDATRADPDLVLLTGDFLTMESHTAADVLARALAPLAKLEGRVFACMGNHDHEAPATVASAMRAIGAQLLIDEATVVEVPWGKVQIVGLDYHFRGRVERIPAALARHPRVPGLPRLVLLHNPGSFFAIPDGEADLVFAGHTHGGQLGLVSLGLRGTFVSLVSNIPDHGLWALGRNRMYVHRGTGHYGFPIRVGVPPEESVLSVHFATPRPASDGPEARGEQPS
jgi:predicted MPP superfamily phosphohydrolase